jgi:uncharacterized membrane protein YphA (DoxX/SURF4 family)
MAFGQAAEVHMKFRNIGYWVATGLVALGFAFGGVMDLMQAPDVLAGFAHLGYPAYLATLLGIWKVLGAVAILAPGFARVKEWAYAGMVFDLTGAAFSHAASGDGPAQVLTPLVFLAILVASYLLRPDSRRMISAPGSARGDEARQLAAV